MNSQNNGINTPRFPYCAVLVFVAFALAWLLISRIDETEACQPVNQMQRLTGLLGLLVFGFAGAWYWYWRRQHRVVHAAILKERVRADTLQMEGDERFRTVFEHTALPMVRNALNGEFI